MQNGKLLAVSAMGTAKTNLYDFGSCFVVTFLVISALISNASVKYLWALRCLFRAYTPLKRPSPC